MRIPIEELSPEALEGVIEEYVSREGTDYGAEEYSLADKVAQVRRQLARGEAVLYFDTYLESCTLLTAEAYRQRLADGDRDEE